MSGSQPGTRGYSGRGFQYVLVAAGPEDLLKVGLTHAPLPRWSAFHPRWFEVFDLDASFLVETETRADAQALETALHRRLVDHGCPVPLTMRLAAGGATEWYRGAFAAAQAFAVQCERDGHVVHWRARDVLAPAMQENLAKLAGLVHEAFSLHANGWLLPEQRRAIRDLVDAHRDFGADIDAIIPDEIRAALGLDG